MTECILYRVFWVDLRFSTSNIKIDFCWYEWWCVERTTIRISQHHRKNILCGIRLTEENTTGNKILPIKHSMLYFIILNTIQLNSEWSSYINSWYSTIALSFFNTIHLEITWCMRNDDNMTLKVPFHIKIYFIIGLKTGQTTPNHALRKVTSWNIKNTNVFPKKITPIFHYYERCDVTAHILFSSILWHLFLFTRDVGIFQHNNLSFS